MSAAFAPTAFVGMSHLGIVSSAGWATFGEAVIGVDPDAERIAALQRGAFPVQEPGLPELWARVQPSLSYSSDLAVLGDCPLVIIARDIPTDDANTSNLEPVLALVDAIAPHLRQDVVLVVMSQVPVGFTRRIGERIAAARPVLRLELNYLVETLIFGDAVRRCLEPERFIVGCASNRTPVAPALAAALGRFPCPILPMAYESAELTKMAINLYLIGAVTYANTLSGLCEVLGADWGDMMPALRLDKRIGPAAYIRPGLGIAGGNLERDLINLRAMAHVHDLPAPYLDALLEANQRRGEWITRNLELRLFTTAELPTVALWGLTYKKDTDSTKNSPALKLIDEIAGRAELRAWDPAVRALPQPAPVTIVADRDAALDGADCLAIMADWDAFAAADLDALRRRMRRPLVIDCVGVLESRRHEMDGIEYVSMGR